MIILGLYSNPSQVSTGPIEPEEFGNCFFQLSRGPRWNCASQIKISGNSFSPDLTRTMPFDFSFYCMAESPSEQDEIKRIPSSAWLPERVRCTHLFVGGLVGGGGGSAWLYSWFQLMWYIIGCEEELNLLSVANSTSPSVIRPSSRGFSHFFPDPSDPFPHYLGAWNRLFPIENFVILLFQYKKIII